VYLHARRAWHRHTRRALPRAQGHAPQAIAAALRTAPSRHRGRYQVTHLQVQHCTAELRRLHRHTQPHPAEQLALSCTGDPYQANHGYCLARHGGAGVWDQAPASQPGRGLTDLLGGLVSELDGIAEHLVPKVEHDAGCPDAPGDDKARGGRDGAADHHEPKGDTQRKGDDQQQCDRRACVGQLAPVRPVSSGQ
jgi:hypothetical protein